MKKRILSVMLMAVCMLSLLAAPALAADETASASDEQSILTVEIEKVNAACVYNIENDRFIFDLDSEEKIYPASTVKLMTAILAIEKFSGQLDHEVTVNGGALIGLRGNNIALKANEVLTVEQLLYALIVGGANDAANVLAIEIAGSIPEFVVMMNERAKELGALDTVYTNPTGMHDPAMVTTARDIAVIATHALKTAPLADMASVEKFVIPPTNKAAQRTIFNKNYYFSTHMEYLYIWKIPRGLNAGYTEEAGSCLVTSASRDGLTYIVVVMGAQTDDKYIYSYTEAADLIKWAFEAYDYTNVLTTSDMICEVPVKLASKVDYVTLFPSENIELYLPVGLDISKDVELEWTLEEEYLTAPVSEGQVAGWLTVTYDGTDLGTFELITRNSVNRNNILYVLDLIAGFLQSSAFRTALIVVIVLIAAYIAALVFLNVRTARRRQALERSRQSRPGNVRRGGPKSGNQRKY